MKLSKKEVNSLKRRLNYHYRYFDFSQISPDPLQFPHKFDDPRDIEISAFISSVFAYGNIKQIVTSLESVHEIINYTPYRFIEDTPYDEFDYRFSGMTHRFYRGEEIASLFKALKNVYDTYGSLKYLFLLYYFEEEENLKNSISFFSRNLLSIASRSKNPTSGLKFMFPDPFNGSACKRMNLFLRWMVRKDDLDFGLWDEIKPSQLIIPVDTHIARISKSLKLTKMKNVSWRMAEEITGNLKRINSEDPVKYDFAICHIGIRKMRFDPIV